MIPPLQLGTSDYISLLGIAAIVATPVVAAAVKIITDVAVLKNDVKAIKRKLGLATNDN